MATSTVRGISFPFRKGVDAFPAKATDAQLIREDLYQLVTTATGSRVMRPTFGTNVYAFIFEPNDDVLGAVIQAELRSSIARHEPRVSVVDIGVSRQDSAVVVTIAYIINATGNQDAIDVGFSTP